MRVGDLQAVGVRIELHRGGRRIGLQDVVLTAAQEGQQLGLLVGRVRQGLQIEADIVLDRCEIARLFRGVQGRMVDTVVDQAKGLD